VIHPIWGNLWSEFDLTTSGVETSQRTKGRGSGQNGVQGKGGSDQTSLQNLGFTNWAWFSPKSQQIKAGEFLLR